VDLWDRLAECLGFEWDEGNLAKNWEKHRVAFWEAEEVFLNAPIAVGLASHPSTPTELEERFYCLGKTDAERYLFIAFTIRDRQIRVISVRDMSRKERRAYQRHAEETNPSV
jgi:uncharacterized DUF497 family protein